MDKHKPWDKNSVIAPKLVGSMTTKEQMKRTFRVTLMASQPPRQERKEKTMCPNIRSCPVFKQTWSSKEFAEEEQHIWTHHWTSEVAEIHNAYPNSNSIQDHGKLQHKFLIFEFLGLNTKQMSQSTKVMNQKSPLKIHESTTSMLNVESTLTGTKQLTTNPIMIQTRQFNLETSTKIRSRKNSEFFNHLLVILGLSLNYFLSIFIISWLLANYLPITDWSFCMIVKQYVILIVVNYPTAKYPCYKIWMTEITEPQLHQVKAANLEKTQIEGQY